MLTAAELIQALQRRLLLQAPHRHRAVGEFPPGWQAWFAAMGERAGAVLGAPAAAIVDLLAQRPPSQPPRRVGNLTRWQAFGALWRQQWQAPAPDERALRWFAIALTALIHVVLALLLTWLALIQFFGAPAPRAGEDVVQVEFIGAGTPEQPGGGQAPPQPEPVQGEPAPAEAPAAPTDAASARAADAIEAPPPPELQAPLPDIVQRDVPVPQLPPAQPEVVEQPVAVSEPRNEEPVTFVLPPPTLRPRPSDAAPTELRANVPEVAAVDVPAPVQPIQREIAPRPLANPQLSSRVPSVSERAIPAPLQPRTPQVREVPVRAPAVRDLSAATPQVRRVDVPTPAGRAAPASASPSTSAPATPAAAASTAPRSATAPAPSLGPASSAPRTATAPGAGVGPQPKPAAGAWPTPSRADDWGDAARDRPGAQAGARPGLYDPEGRLRVPETPGSAAPGQPPGTITEEIADLDRSGTWLKRRPSGYEPTLFERYWVPNENLLEEWVRKGIKKVLVPIPGTGKRLECVVSLLQAAGGCTVSDPNLNEQPATARPPPDIPFKPELQEDNGAVKPAP